MTTFSSFQTNPKDHQETSHAEVKLFEIRSEEVKDDSFNCNDNNTQFSSASIRVIFLNFVEYLGNRIRSDADESHGRNLEGISTLPHDSNAKSVVSLFLVHNYATVKNFKHSISISMINKPLKLRLKGIDQRANSYVKNIKESEKVTYREEKKKKKWRKKAPGIISPLLSRGSGENFKEPVRVQL